jgi:methyltransferase (TIGR00027 family)
MQLSEVSKTAISTLRCRAMESARDRPLISDPIATCCVERLAALASPEERALLFDRKLPPGLCNYIALRARKYDAITNEFIAAHPGCVVVNLGCGFDTRYWRIDHARCDYVELDLPELVEMKRQVLAERLDYRLIGGSVLDPAWMHSVNPDGRRETLLLAEGLFMYLPKPDVLSLFGAISNWFRDSRLVFEVATEAYTHGFMKRIVAMKIRRQTGADAGASYQFGVRSAREVESYGRGLKVLSEWSYMEDPDVRPRLLKYLGLTRQQWTVVLGVNEVDSGA